MNKAGGFITSVTIILLALAAMISCASAPVGQSPTRSPPPPVATDKQENEIRTVTFEQPRLKLLIMEWWPVEVINVAEVKHRTGNGDWVIEIRNVSDKPIKSVMMEFSPPADCDAFVMSFGLFVGLGEDKYLTKPANPTLVPGETDRIIIEGKELDSIMPLKELKGCPPEKSYSHLHLENVIYVDGTKWERRYEIDDPNRPVTQTDGETR